MSLYFRGAFRCGAIAGTLLYLELVLAASPGWSLLSLLLAGSLSVLVMSDDTDNPAGARKALALGAAVGSVAVFFCAVPAICTLHAIQLSRAVPPLLRGVAMTQSVPESPLYRADIINVAIISLVVVIPLSAVGGLLGHFVRRHRFGLAVVSHSSSTK